jgi:hypothetical protein
MMVSEAQDYRTELHGWLKRKQTAGGRESPLGGVLSRNAQTPSGKRTQHQSFGGRQVRRPRVSVDNRTKSWRDS